MARAVQPLRAEALRHQGHWTGEARPCRPRARLKETQGRPKFPGSPSGGRTPQRGGLGGHQYARSFTRRRAIDWLCNWHTRDSVTLITAAISFRFMSCS